MGKDGKKIQKVVEQEYSTIADKALSEESEKIELRQSKE